ncbi:hypothetical protein B0H14DRAFT_2646627 [Mycena olivaceomarginata]|nr:hypothetical protein B0H14DRAFT_2646627 [Mycena olivaceomarginata]
MIILVVSSLFTSQRTRPNITGLRPSPSAIWTRGHTPRFGRVAILGTLGANNTFDLPGHLIHRGYSPALREMVPSASRSALLSVLERTKGYSERTSLFQAGDRSEYHNVTVPCSAMHHPNCGGCGHGVHGTRSQVSSGADFLEDITLTADVGVYFSATLGKRREELLNVSHKKRKLQLQELDDTLAEWKLVNPDVHDWDHTPDAAADLASESSAPATPTVLGKHKTYESSMDQMGLWQPKADFFLDGLATMVWRTTTALIWAVPYVHVAMRRADNTSNAVRLFKCHACGEFLQCKACCIAGHTRTPLHVLQEWNGNYWVDITLQELGFVYQIGHGGMPCRSPDPRLLTMTVIELPVIHRVSYRYCKCKMADTTTNVQQLLRNGWYPATITDPATCATFTTLEMFRLQNVVANMNANDFITAIERQTNATVSTGMDWLPMCFIPVPIQLALTCNEYSIVYKEFMRMSGQWAYLKRAKRAGHTHDSTGVAGDGAMDGRTLTRSSVVLDTNFKLKNCMHQNERPDPPLGPGLGYFVDSAKYRRHLRKYILEKDYLHAFAALLQKDTWGMAGLRTSGVVCSTARDWGFAEGRAKINLAKRNMMMPENMKLPLDTIKLEFQVGCWQKRTGRALSGHGRSSTLLRIIQRTWGKGNWMGTLEDKIDSHNYLKNLGLGNALRRKLAVTHMECDWQVQAFKDVCKTVEQEVMDKWQGEIDTWLKDLSKSNPILWRGKRWLAALVATDREQKIQELCLTTLKKIATFHKLRAIYMPGVASAIETDEVGHDPDEPPPQVEKIKLYMPSDLSAADRLSGCMKNLPDIEVKMWIAQCDNVLVVMRGRLHAKRHLITFHNENITGQIKSTKARTLIEQCGVWGSRPANHSWSIEMDNVLDMAVKASSGDAEHDLHNSVRVGWARAKACKMRWVEEGDEIGRGDAVHLALFGMAGDVVGGAGWTAGLGPLSSILKLSGRQRCGWILRRVMEAADLAQFFMEESVAYVSIVDV